MSAMFDYLRWRGDILFSQLPVNQADTLIFAALSYIRFEDVVPEDCRQWITLADAARKLLALPQPESRVRVEQDLKLLELASRTERFGKVGLTFYRSVFDPEQETQFAAVTFLLEDGTAFLTFRGTDSTLVGWKEDFNMTFQESVPAQRLAREYTLEFARASGSPLRLGGHSKGGNLAVYAAAKCPEEVQDRILEVYNHDGPGFTQRMMTDPGYLRIVPRVRTFVPQSSVFGMLLDHEEPYTVIKSRQVGLMQHDPYSWEILGPGFIPVEELTAGSRFLDKTFKIWLAGLTVQERSDFFDAVFDLLMADNASSPRDLVRPQNLRTLLKNLQTDDDRRTLIGSVLLELVESAKNVHSEMSGEASGSAEEPEK